MFTFRAQFIELGFKAREVLVALRDLGRPDSGPRCTGRRIQPIEEVVEHLVVSIAVTPNSLQSFRFTDFSDVICCLLKIGVKPRAMLTKLSHGFRSEERRVGKECRS